MDGPKQQRSGLGHIVEVLRHRNYRLLWTGTLISNTGDWMDQVALNWLVLQMTGSAVDLGLVNLFRALPILALTLIGGVAADRFERRRLMMVSQSVGMVLAAILAVLVGAGSTAIWAIFLIAAARGATIAFNQPARHSLVSEVVPRDSLPSAIALNSLTINLTKVLGPLLAGIVIGAAGTTACFAINAASFLPVLWTLARMSFPARVGQRPREPVLRSLLEGLAYLGSNRLLLLLVFVAFIPVLFGQPYLYLLPLFAVEVYRTGPEMLGAMTAFAAAGSMLGALTLALVPRLGRSGGIMLAIMLGFGVAIVCFAFAPTLAAACVLLVLLGAGQTTCNSTNNILLQSIVPDAVRGRVLSVLLLNRGLVQIGTAIIATLAAMIGVRLALALSGGVVVLSATAIRFGYPAMRRLRV